MMQFDETQRAVLRLDRRRHARILGAPGTGKTRTLVEAHLSTIERDGWNEEEVLSMAPTRLGSALLRDRLEARSTSALRGTAVRTAASLAFVVLSRAAAVEGGAAPRLLTGRREDEAIERVIEAMRSGDEPPDAASFPEQVLTSAGFRAEVRQLMRVCDDYAVAPGELAARIDEALELGARQSVTEAPDPELAARWRAGLSIVVRTIRLLREERPGEFSSSGLLRRAAERVLSDGGIEPGARLRIPALLLIDDAQDLSEGELALVAACAARGTAVWVFGDPDAATAAFQGESTDLMTRLEDELARRGAPHPAQRSTPTPEGDPAQSVVLAQSHRHDRVVLEVIEGLNARIGSRGATAHRVVRERHPAADGASYPPSHVRFFEAGSTAEQLGAIAHCFRSQKLGVGGAPATDWSEMAVICRSRSEAVGVARTLAAHQVPTRVSAGGVVIGEHRLVHDLVAVLRFAMGLHELTGGDILQMLAGPLGSLDPVSMRRLRRELLIAERRAAAEEQRSPEPVDAVAWEGFATPIGEPLVDSAGGRALRSLGRIAAAARTVHEAGGTPREALWAAWDASGLAARLQTEALDGRGTRADEAGRSLDAVLALFFVLQRHEEQDSDQPIDELLTAMIDSPLPEDTLAAPAARSAVTVTTPQGAIGLEADVVAVLGVQDGAWPNLKARGSLLGTSALERWLRGGAALPPTRRETLHDELRLFSFSCARARRELLVVAVADDEQHPSPFFRFGEPYRVTDLPTARLTLRGATAQMRRRLERDATDAEAVESLVRLADSGVPGADPEEWYGVREPSTARPLVDLDGDPEAVVRVSPSELERAENCPLDWVIGMLGGDRSTVQSGIGTLVHHAFETATDADPEALMQAVLSQWSKLPFEAEWESKRVEQQAHAMVTGAAAYLRDFAASGRELLGQESRFHAPIERALLTGVADRLEAVRREDGTLEVTVLDLKTGRTAPSANETETHAQLQAYQAGVVLGAFDLGSESTPRTGSEPGSGSESESEVESARETGSESAANSAGDALAVGGARLLYVHPDAAKKEPYIERAQAPISDETLEAFTQRVGEVARVMASGTFTAQVEHHCRDPYQHGRCRLHIIPPVSEA